MCNKRSRRRILLIIFIILLLNYEYLNSLLVNLNSHISFTMYEMGLAQCGFRKYPTLIQHTTNTITLIFETNCDFNNPQIHFFRNSLLQSAHTTLRYQAPNTYIYETQFEVPEKGKYRIVIPALDYETETNCLSTTDQCTPLRLAVLSDNQFGARIFHSIATQVKSHHPQYLLHLGTFLPFIHI
jgi:hypothetical protein